jgi:hypothetical protein
MSSRILSVSVPVVLLLSNIFMSPCFAGSGTSGGGDAAEAEFSNIGKSVVSDLLNKHIQVGYDLNALSTAVANTQVTMVRHPITVEGQQRDALNIPSLKQIEVDRNNWISLQAEQKVELAYHEYLGIAGVEFNKYSSSQSLLSLLGADELNKIDASAIPDPVYSCKVTQTLDEKESDCGQITLRNKGGWDTLPGCSDVLIQVVDIPTLGFSYSIAVGNLKTSSGPADSYNVPENFFLNVSGPAKKRGHFQKYEMTCSKQYSSN